MTELLIITLAWVLYGLVHSLLASVRVKRWVAENRPDLMPAYRLAFNIAASVLLLPPLWLTYQHESDALWRWPIWISLPITVVVVVGFLLSMRHRGSGYDSQEFMGFKQLRQQSRQILDTEPLHISRLHRFVRHPWYFLGLLFLWTRDLNAAWLLSTSIITLYIWLGSALEERKLVALHGEIYQRYQSRVPGLLPIPGRSLSPEEARDLEHAARLQQG